MKTTPTSAGAMKQVLYYYYFEQSCESIALFCTKANKRGRSNGSIKKLKYLVGRGIVGYKVMKLSTEGNCDLCWGD